MWLCLSLITNTDSLCILNFITTLILGVWKTFRAEDYHRCWTLAQEQFITDNWPSTWAVEPSGLFSKAYTSIFCFFLHVCMDTLTPIHMFIWSYSLSLALFGNWVWFLNDLIGEEGKIHLSHVKHVKHWCDKNVSCCRRLVSCICIKPGLLFYPVTVPCYNV